MPWRPRRRRPGACPGSATGPVLRACSSKAAWAGPRETIYATGALWTYAQLVGPAHLGACTHPGGAEEKHVYMDL